MIDPPSPPRRVLVLADAVSATQRISFEQPLRSAVGLGHASLTMAGDDPAWDEPGAREAFLDAAAPTVLVLSRYANDRASGFLASARRRGIPSVFHLDDDLLDVPLSLGRAKFDHYHHPPRLAALRAALQGADLVYASTGPLADRVREHGITTRIVAGELYCTAESARLPVPLPATVPVIGYMGTGGHSEDLAMVMPAVRRLMDEIPSLRFETFGSIKPPAEMKPYPARYAHHAGVADYDGFIERLCTLGWWIGLAPLEDNAFNRCKADTKWVEYTQAGIAVVASALPVYERAAEGGGSAERALTPDQWHASLRRLVTDGQQRATLVRRAREHLARSYTRERLAAQLVSILDLAATRA